MAFTPRFGSDGDALDGSHIPLARGEGGDDPADGDARADGLVVVAENRLDVEDLGLGAQVDGAPASAAVAGATEFAAGRQRDAVALGREDHLLEVFAAGAKRPPSLIRAAWLRSTTATRPR